MTDAAFESLLHGAAVQLREERMAEAVPRRHPKRIFLCAALLAGLLSVFCLAAEHFQFYTLKSEETSQKINYYFSSDINSGDTVKPRRSFTEFLPSHLVVLEQRSLSPDGVDYEATLFSLNDRNTEKTFQILTMPAEQFNLFISAFTENHVPINLSKTPSFSFTETFVNGYRVYSSSFNTLFEIDGIGYYLPASFEPNALSEILDAAANTSVS